MAPPDETVSVAARRSQSFTFVDLLYAVLKHRMLLAIGTLVALLCGILYVFFLGGLYRSEAVLNLRYVSFAEYKRYSTALADRERFLEFAARSKRFSDTELDKVRRALGGPEALGKWVHPLFTITKADVKDAAETPKDANQFTGVDIDVTLNSREVAQNLVLVGSDYIRSFVIEGRILDLVLPGLATARADLSKKEIDILRSRFDLERLKQRRSELQVIANRYRGVDRETQQRQVISTQDGGEKYLSPVTQVIGVEAQIVEANSDISGLQRDVDRLNVLISFYSDARTRLEKARLGEQLPAMEQAFAELPQKRDLNSESARDAVATIRADLEQLRAYNDDYLRLAALPSSRSQLGSIIVWAPIILAALVGFLLSLLIAITWEWWRENRSAVMSAHAR